MQEQLIIIKRQFKLINKQVSTNYPYETGGFFGGRKGVILGIYPIANSNIGPEAETAFAINGNDLLAACQFFKANSLEIMGNYHSHPRGSARPSGQDMKHFVGDGLGRYQLIISIKPAIKNKNTFVVKYGIYFCPSNRETIPLQLKVIADKNIKEYLRKRPYE